MTRDSKLICSVVFRNVDFLQFVLDESSSLGLERLAPAHGRPLLS